MMQKIIIVLLITLVNGVYAQKKEKRVFGPLNSSSISIPDDWNLVADDERTIPQKLQNLAVSREYAAKDKSRVMLIVIEKEGFPEGKRDASPADVAKSLTLGFVATSDALAIRNGGVGKMGGLKSANLHAIHSKGKTLLESYISAAEDEINFYVIIGIYHVSDYRKRGREISKIIQSFQLSEEQE